MMQKHPVAVLGRVEDFKSCHYEGGPMNFNFTKNPSFTMWLSATPFQPTDNVVKSRLSERPCIIRSFLFVILMKHCELFHLDLCKWNTSFKKPHNQLNKDTYSLYSNLSETVTQSTIKLRSSFVPWESKLQVNNLHLIVTRTQLLWDTSRQKVVQNTLSLWQ